MTNEHLRLLKHARASWLYPVYVPSYSRAGVAPLLNMLEGAYPAAKRKVHIVTQAHQTKDYQSAYPWATLTDPVLEPGVGPARMHCLLDADARGYQRIVVLDDDITHLSLLEMVERDNGTTHARRYSARVSGIQEPHVLVRSLSAACRMASVVFESPLAPSYGSARNALFSGDVDTRIGATFNKGSFPACVMFYDTLRFTMRSMPAPFQYHGEDLAMFLDAYENHQNVFTLPSVAYDQHGSLQSTIPLDPESEIGRPHLDYTEEYYPRMHPFLRVSMKNKLGGTKRIGVNWNRWYKDTRTAPTEILLKDIIKEIPC